MCSLRNDTHLPELHCIDSTAFYYLLSSTILVQLSYQLLVPVFFGHLRALTVILRIIWNCVVGFPGIRLGQQPFKMFDCFPVKTLANLSCFSELLSHYTPKRFWNLINCKINRESTISLLFSTKRFETINSHAFRGLFIWSVRLR